LAAILKYETDLESYHGWAWGEVPKPRMDLKLSSFCTSLTFKVNLCFLLMHISAILRSSSHSAVPRDFDKERRKAKIWRKYDKICIRISDLCVLSP